MSSRFVAGTPGIVSADQALALLGPERLDKLNDAVLTAWDRYRRSVAPLMGKPPKRLRANVMQAFMVEEVEKRFGGELDQRGGRALLCSVPGLVVQMKKLNERGLPSNYPTPTALKFAAQVKIAGIPAGTRLTLGYVLDSRGTDIAEVRLLLQLGARVEWSQAISSSNTQTIIPLMAPPATLPTNAATPKHRKLQPKGLVGSKKDRKPGS